MSEPRMIYVTEHDRNRLLHLIESMRRSWRDQHLAEMLEQELERAKVLPRDKIPSGVVTMNSRVRVHDMKAGKDITYQVVFPRDADPSQSRVSVLAPIGMALLGYEVGSEVEWETPGGRRHLRIEALEYQPEAARAVA